MERHPENHQEAGREMPVEEMGPIPIWLIAVVTGLIVWAGLYLFMNARPGLYG